MLNRRTVLTGTLAAAALATVPAMALPFVQPLSALQRMDVRRVSMMIQEALRVDAEDCQGHLYPDVAQYLNTVSETKILLTAYNNAGLIQEPTIIHTYDDDGLTVVVCYSMQVTGPARHMIKMQVVATGVDFQELALK
jgi:hypothetical protein